MLPLPRDEFGAMGAGAPDGDGETAAHRRETTPAKPLISLEWRRRKGVEPSGDLTAAHAVLKTGEATGPHPPPWSVSCGRIEVYRTSPSGASRAFFVVVPAAGIKSES